MDIIKELKDNDIIITEYSYKLDIYKGCITFRDSKLIAACAIDKVESLLTESNAVYNAWRRLNHKESYENTNKKALTIVWR